MNKPIGATYKQLEDNNIEWVCCSDYSHRSVEKPVWVLRHSSEYEWAKERTMLLQEIANLKRKNMNPDINLLQEIPQEVKDAALLLENYFKKKDIDKWALYDVCSRKLVDEAYNNGLNTAISLVKECGDSETIICGLENSKKETPATYFIHE